MIEWFDSRGSRTSGGTSFMCSEMISQTGRGSGPSWRGEEQGFAAARRGPGAVDVVLCPYACDLCLHDGGLFGG